MKKRQLLQILEELDFFPGRQLGQNFLIDTNMRDFIVRTADPQPGEVILEVGPGFGVMTGKLLELGAKVIAIEIDKRICEYLKSTISHSNFRLIKGDACRTDLEAIPELRTDFRCVANLPYSASTPMIAHLLFMERPPQGMLFMLQKEMADRLCANKGTKDYGSLSVQVQYVYDAKTERTVPKQVFYPMPEIDSAIVDFKRKEKAPNLEQREKLKRVVQSAFSQRRKKVLNLLAQNYDKSRCAEAFEKLGIRQDSRAEHIDIDTFAKLAKLL